MRVARPRAPSPTTQVVIAAYHAHPSATSTVLAGILNLDPSYIRNVLQKAGLSLRRSPPTSAIPITRGGPDVNRAGKTKLPPVAKVTQTEIPILPSAAHGTADTGPRVASSGPVAEGCAHIMMAQVVGTMAQCASCRTWIRVPGR